MVMMRGEVAPLAPSYLRRELVILVLLCLASSKGEATGHSHVGTYTVTNGYFVGYSQQLQPSDLVQTGQFITQAVHTVPGSTTSGVIEYNQTKNYNGYPVPAYYAWIDNPLSFFHVYYPRASDGSCDGYVLTSEVAAQEKCLHATNGGPFIMNKTPPDPTCLGFVIGDGHTAQLQDTQYANFGVTSEGEYIMGVLTTAEVKSMPFTQLLSGFGWLVQKGVNMVTTSGGLIAPRTAIGTDKEGRMIMFEADGVEQLDQGLTLQQLANWLVSLGVYNAINLDGGGSSVTVVNGTIADVPTCSDTPVMCERKVTTLVCVK